MSCVHIIDDDEAIRDALSWLLGSRGVAVQAWESAESFLEAYRSDLRGCLLLDIRMGGMSGLELFDRLRDHACALPVIFLTGHADVPMAVAALKRGARDFVEKPFNDNDLVDRLLEALAAEAEAYARSASKADRQTRLATLSSRERQVMDLILEGLMNKVIADRLGISMRTVEVHRARVLEKMGAKTAVDLARLVAGE
ncbi:histidine kinase [Elstera litoralis]|uniref:Histidine kinase n=1 Tax=Elstera litoralis TaxID=552518 RepID=A0A0F3ITD6_9PROT|nr:response regulator [Elstera litoralis]KJV10000.1 histidine kinase [Elstera litoralis]